MDPRFAALKELLSQYRDGDLLSLSEIDDLVSGLKAELDSGPGKAGTVPYFDAVTSHLDAALRGGAAFDAAFVFKRVEAAANAASAAEITKGTESDSEAEDAESLAFFANVLETFLIEAAERVARAQELILAIENLAGSAQPEDLLNPEGTYRESLTELFRIFHTIKGECGMLKVASLGEIAHSVEGLLSLIREGSMDFNPSVAEILLEGVDHAKSIIAELKSGKAVLFGASAMNEFINRVNAIGSRVRPSIGDLLVAEGSLSESERQRVLSLQKQSAYTKRFGEIAVEETSLDSLDVARALESQGGNTPNKNRAGLHDNVSSPDAATSTSLPPRARESPMIKVRADRVGFLVDMIGELTIALGQLVDSEGHLAHIRKITRSLQRASMDLRTDSARTLFGTMKRTVRDLSRRFGKPVEVGVDGEDLEIDRVLMESLEEPLMHLVRNSMDHGIETPEQRRAAGKPETARVFLSAGRHGNSIVISVEDDGRGLDREKILAKALEKGLVDPGRIASMGDMEVFDLIFESGFTTSETVSIVSGRGMGMDIVRDFVQRHRGRVTLRTSPGAGTRFDLVFPLNTAIMEGMVVTSGGHDFILPISAVAETLGLGRLSTVAGSTRVVEIRGASLPVINLSKALGLKVVSGNDGDERARGFATDGEAVRTDRSVGVVIEGRNRFVLAVDAIVAKQEVVIKPLGGMFAGLKGVSGATVLSGGRIGLVLDIEELISREVLPASR